MQPYDPLPACSRKAIAFAPEESKAEFIFPTARLHPHAALRALLYPHTVGEVYVITSSACAWHTTRALLCPLTVGEVHARNSGAPVGHEIRALCSPPLLRAAKSTCARRKRDDRVATTRIVRTEDTIEHDSYPLRSYLHMVFARRSVPERALTIPTTTITLRTRLAGPHPC